MENNITNQAAPLDIPDIPTAAPIEKRRYSTFESLAALVCLPLGFMFTHLVFTHPGSIWGGLFWMLIGALLAVFTLARKTPVKPFQILLFAVAEIFCLVPLFSSSIGINVLAAMFSFGLIFYLAVTLSGADVLGKHFVRDFFSGLYVKPFTRFGECPKALFSLVHRAKGGKTLLFILLGLLLALPITPIILHLLISSDRMFADALEGFMSSLPEFSRSTFFELIFAIPIAFYLCGMLFRSAEKNAPRPDTLPTYRVFPLAVSCAAVTPVCVFYIAYILVQLNYLAAAFGGALPEQYSYAEFARSGFFELCTIAFINLCLIVLIQTFTARKQNDSRPALLKIYTVILSGCTLLLIASAMSRMLLYISEYGMTGLRVMTSWFMILLAVIFVVIILWQFVKLPLWKVLFAAFTVLFGILCFGNTDGMIARYNVNAYLSGQHKELDWYTLEKLGPPAAEYIITLGEEFSDKKDTYFERTYKRYCEDYPLPDYFSIYRVNADNVAEEYRNEH